MDDMRNGVGEIVKRLDSRQAWDEFVLFLFLKNYTAYAARYGWAGEDIKDDIIETAEKVGEFAWKQKRNDKIGPWEIEYVVALTHNQDNWDNPSMGRIVNPDLNKLLLKIEGKKLNEKFAHRAAIMNGKKPGLKQLKV